MANEKQINLCCFNLVVLSLISDDGAGGFALSDDRQQSRGLSALLHGVELKCGNQADV